MNMVKGEQGSEFRYTVIVIGVNKVNKGIGDQGIFKKYRIANMIRQR